MNDTIFSVAHFAPDAVVIDNGTYPTAPQALQWINSAPYLVCCDGAADYFLSIGGVPDAIVGDGDSISQQNAQRYAAILHRYSEQDNNDQTKAVNFLCQSGYRRVVIVGGTGKREDHTLGNISLLVEYMRRGLSVLMATDYGVFVPCNGDCSFGSYPGQQISIFNFNAVHFHSERLVYSLPELTMWWQGTLNEAQSTSFSIYAQGDYLVYLNY